MEEQERENIQRLYDEVRFDINEIFEEILDDVFKLIAKTINSGSEGKKAGVYLLKEIKDQIKNEDNIRTLESFLDSVKYLEKRINKKKREQECKRKRENFFKPFIKWLEKCSWGD